MSSLAKGMKFKAMNSPVINEIQIIDKSGVTVLRTDSNGDQWVERNWNEKLIEKRIKDGDMKIIQPDNYSVW